VRNPAFTYRTSSETGQNKLQFKLVFPIPEKVYSTKVLYRAKSAGLDDTRRGWNFKPQNPVKMRPASPFLSLKFCEQI